MVAFVRNVKHFGTPAVEGLARRVEREAGPPFETYGAILKTCPVRMSRIRSVTEGVRLYLDPGNAKTWEWWGDFEGPHPLELRRRRRFSREWHELRTPAEVEDWLKQEASAYLAELREKEQSLTLSR